MTLLRESYLYHIWLAVLAAYRESALGRWMERLGDWCGRQIDGSVLLRPLCREGVVARSWEGSVLCRLLMFLANLPGELLHRLYRAFRATFEDSFFARLAFGLGEETAIAQSWLITLLWVIPFQYWSNSYSLLGFTMLLILFHAGAMRHERFRLDLGSMGFYPVLLLGSVFLGTVLSYSPALSGRFLLYHISAALCALLTVSAVRCEGDLKRLAAGGAVCVLVSSLYGVYQRIQGVEVKRAYVDLSVNQGMPGRVESFFDNPNTYGEVLILLLPLVLALVLCSRSLWGRLASGAAFALGVAALGMTYSRSSWVGFAAAMVVMVFLWRPRLLPAFAVACVVCVPLLPDTIWNRILTIGAGDRTATSRIPLWQAAAAAIRLRPVRGAGLGTDTPRAFIKAFDLYHAAFPYVHAHNFFLEVWLEAGLLGLIGFTASALWNIKRAARAVRRCRDSAARTIAGGAAASLCGILVCGLMDYPWHYPRVMCMFWFVFAMALAGTKLCLRERTD